MAQRFTSRVRRGLVLIADRFEAGGKGQQFSAVEHTDIQMALTWIREQCDAPEETAEQNITMTRVKSSVPDWWLKRQKTINK